jgi:hypothetical protein
MTNRCVSRTIFLALVLFATAGGGGAEAACSTREGTCSPVLQVPSRLYPTIRSAVAAAPTGSTIQLAAGVYDETIRIEGKSITLRGPEPGDGAATIVGADRDAAAITYGAAGGGSVVNLALRGGAYGVAAVRSGERAPAPVEIKRTSISDTGRGIFGDFSRLNVKNTTISRTAWNGIAVTSADDVSLKEITVFGAIGYGIYVQDAAVSLSNVLVHDNLFGGIYLGESFAQVLGGLVFQNRRSGITIVSSPLVLLQGVTVDNTLPQSDGRFGDGIDVFLSQVVGVIDTFVGYNARVAIASFGGDVQIGDTDICCSPIDFEVETYMGQPGQLEKIGDNTCWCGDIVHECQAQSADIGPPELGEP